MDRAVVDCDACFWRHMICVQFVNDMSRWRRSVTAIGLLLLRRSGARIYGGWPLKGAARRCGALYMTHLFGVLRSVRDKNMLHQPALYLHVVPVAFLMLPWCHDRDAVLNRPAVRCRLSVFISGQAGHIANEFRSLLCQVAQLA